MGLPYAEAGALELPQLTPDNRVLLSSSPEIGQENQYKMMSYPC
jgi:hypothetical protein